MKKLFILIALIFMLTGCSNEEGTITKITCDQMKKLLTNSKTILLDVRSKEEYNEGHLEKAENSPLTELSDLKDIDHLASETPIIVYCKSGVRSNEAAKELLKMGFKNIYDLGAMSKCA
jgi:rhodanese-related sulfurtransferase